MSLRVFEKQSPIKQKNLLDKICPFNRGLLRRKNTVSQRHILRKIAPHAGMVKSVLRLFDELAKCDNEGILKDAREAAEGKVT